MTTDWKALCAELLAWAEKTSSNYYKQADVLLRARAALAEQPVGEGPTDDEIHDFIALWWQDFGKGYVPCSSDKPLVKAALARWGNHQVSLTSSTQPLPKQEVSE